MQQYRVKGSDSFKTIVEVLQKDRHGYTIKIKKERSWGCKEEVHQMSEQLFDTCVRTGYLVAVSAKAEARSA